MTWDCVLRYIDGYAVPHMNPARGCQFQAPAVSALSRHLPQSLLCRFLPSGFFSPVPVVYLLKMHPATGGPVPNDQSHDTRTAIPANRVAQAVSLTVTPIAGSVPGVPTFTTSTTATTATATITDANGATSYQVSVDGINWVAGLTVSGLTPETAYTLQVRGINQYGTGSAGSAGVTTGAAGGGSGDITFTGTVSHGSVITIADAQSRFGSRTNVKPLYVNIGDGELGSALGRITNNYFDTAAVYGTSKNIGSVPGSVAFNHSGNTNDAFGSVPFDSSKPLIQYLERYYDYDINDPAQQSPGTGFNLKPNRFWVTAGANGPNNLYIGLQGTEGGSIRFVAENVGETGAYREFYGAQLPWSTMRFRWTSEEIHFENSDVGVDNGWIQHFFDSTQRIDANTNCRTRSSTNSSPLAYAFLDQVAAGALLTSNTYYGYQCWDDEYEGVYVGDASTRAACTRLVRQPQTAWAAGQVSVHLIESHVNLAAGYLYFRTGKTSWITDTGVAL